MTVKILPVLLLFLLLFYVFSAVDLAVAGSLILAAVLFRIAAVWLFSVAFLSLVLFFISPIFNIHPDFVVDLSVTSYALFVAGLALFFIRREKLNLPQAMSQNNYFKFIGILLVGVLIYPLFGMTVTMVLSYGGLLLAFPRFRSSRLPFIIATFFLLSSPVFLIIQRDNTAVQSAILAYSFLIIGVFRVLADSVRRI